MKPAILFLFMMGSLTGQTILRGTVKNEDTNESLSYVSIGIIGKTVGALSDSAGFFQLALKPGMEEDSIKFWLLGYTSKTFAIKDLITFTKDIHEKKIMLKALTYDLEEVNVSAKRTKQEILGTKKYTKGNCSGFVKNSDNWKGSETAILAGNKKDRQVWLESFSFYIVQNKYEDSLRFRLTLYEASDKKYPRLKSIQKKPVIFKVGTKQGEFALDLKPYNIVTSKDFFISLECLMNEMDITKFCFAGSNSTPSFVKPAAFERWRKVKGGGADFNVKVSYVK